ncbi:uncharacterized protein LOC143259120 [Megalopta genalis]|uniref:uncharacterized protein LOC143259120 n=1 Tax=Megalopta genalis TaxID=115081 RepID=UPI003FD31BA7
MDRHVRPFFFLLLAVQLEQFFPWKQGTFFADAGMEAQFEKCCGLGTSWATEGLKCEKFTGPINGVPTEEQDLCLQSVDICCVKAYRERQCEKGKSDARAGLACVSGTKARRIGTGDYHRDCCEGCKLGILSGSTGQGCAFKTFSFGIPWDPAFMECCTQALPNTTTTFTSESTNSTSPSEKTETSSSPLSSPSASSARTTDFSPSIPTPPLDDICQIMKGMLCSDICIPTATSYYCKCREGFTLLEDQKTCRQDLPTDRCKTSNPCEQRCTDNGVAVTCSCDPGYVLANDNHSCIPKSAQQNNTAAPDETTDLSPICPPGYRYNATNQVCDDVNECIEKGLCPGQCANTIGSYVCVSKDELNSMSYEGCPPGYQWEPRTGLCTDIDECAVLPQPCPAERRFCVNTQGSFSCLEKKGAKSCPAGFKFDQLLQQCKDVDECAESIHSCLEDSEECKNTEGAYECNIKCRKGFIYSNNLGVCIDVDECIELNNPCPELNAICRNTIGDYECTLQNHSLPQYSSDQLICFAGYKPADNPEETCIDVDECKEQLHSCETTEECVNEIGSYRCELINEKNASSDQSMDIANRTMDCQIGFVFDPQSLDCTDIDECSNGLSNCGIGEQCENYAGGYSCLPICPPGFQPHNSTDYFRTADSFCEDINECELGIHTCNITSQDCVNTNGSYFCDATTKTTTTTTPRNSIRNLNIEDRKALSYQTTCERGYERNSATGECTDINECEQGRSCRDHERCHNIPGGYECSPLCTSGWYFNTQTKGCQDVDECLLGSHDCSQSTHICRNTNGSFVCDLLPPCESGFEYNHNGICVDIDECLDDSLHHCDIERHYHCVNLVGHYDCVWRKPSCQSGYVYSFVDKRCVDIDECVNGKNNCNSRSERCINLPGTYRCERRKRDPPPDKSGCPPGYKYCKLLGKCLNIDECTENPNICNGELCYNQPGTHTCTKPPTPIMKKPPANQKCSEGTRFIRNRGCIDIDECREIEDVCSSNEDCVNTIGSYTCNCKIGFKRDNLTQACVDINECQMREDNCLPTQRCDNTIGSYSCTRFLPCGTGYTLNAATEICEDDDECTLGTHDCGEGYHCRNTIGSYRCDRNSRMPNAQPRIGGPTTTVTRTTSTTTMAPMTPPLAPGAHSCPRGFRLESGNKCADIDECQNNPCRSPYQLCINTIGSYRCASRVICGNGYTLDPVYGTHCVDIDECTSGSHECSSNQICENRIGGYVCKCLPGHVIGPNNECVDIDECSLYGNICGSNSQCENTVGSYRCVCRDGFQNVDTFGGVCEDIDECQRNPGLCQHKCVNIWGSYRCSCELGYRLNADNRSCSDIDECTEFRNNHLCIGICENTPGSYTCKCPKGYRLGYDERSCEDINECNAGQVCRASDEICHNTRGSYRCNRINCPAGYHQDAVKKNRCVRGTPCQSSDLACIKSPSHYSYNFITLVSMLPIAPNKSEELFKMRGFPLASSTLQFSMAFVEARAPPGVQRATESCFALRRTAPTNVILLMTQSIQGPQDIELDITMEVYYGPIYAGCVVAKVLIFVSEYEF